MGKFHLNFKMQLSLLILTLHLFILTVSSWVMFPPVVNYNETEEQSSEVEGSSYRIDLKVPDEGSCGEKLFMTKLLDDIDLLRRHPPRGKSEDDVHYVWREQARVSPNISLTKSYSGFFTVNEEFNSNLFFWFVPAAFEPEKSPLILWLAGGPGTSSLFALFVENGPFQVNKEGFLENRQYAWTMTHSVIYIDSPVGTGFSFTEDPQGYAKDQEDIADNLYKALTQFFRAFPEFSARDLYIAGESYAGKYVPSLSLKIHTENQGKRPNKKIKLRGLIIGSGYFDPESQNEYGDYLFNLGLIDDVQKSVFKVREERIKELIENEEWIEATNAVEKLIVGEDVRIPSLFQNMTGFVSYANIMQVVSPISFKYFVPFINKVDTRQGIHVGDQPFTRKPQVVENLVEDISKSVKSTVETLLTQNYRILLYTSQFDLVVPHTGVQKFISKLEWPGARLFARAPRRPYKVNGEIAGYTKFARNLAHVFLRNAGHVAPNDQPLWCYDMVNRFTRGKPF